MSLTRYIIIVSIEKVNSSAISTTQTVNCFFLIKLIKCIICPLCFYRNRYRDAYPKVILKRVVTLTASGSSSAFLVQTIRINFWGAFLLILPFHQPYTVRTCSIIIIYRMPWMRFCFFVLFVFGCPPIFLLSLTCPCARLTSAACCRLRATCAAMTRWRSTTSRQQAQRQSRQRQKRLWPFRQETTPWFRQRAHFGLRVILRGFIWGCCCCPSGNRTTLFSPPSRGHPSGLVTSKTSSDFSSSSFTVVSGCRPPPS